MRIIKRILLAVGLLAVAVMVFLPPLVGIGAERIYPGLVASARFRLDNFDVDSRKFERGWFTSTAKVVVRAHSGQWLTWTDTFRHGPWTGSPGWLAASGRLEHPEQGVITTLDYRVGPSGRTTGQFTLRWQDQASTARLDGTFSARDRFRDLDLTLSPVALSNAGLELVGGRLELTARRHRRSLSDAQMVIEIDRLRMDRTTAESLRVETDYQREQWLAALNVQLSADDLAWPGEQLRSAQAELSLDQLHRPTIWALSQAMEGTLRSDLPPEQVPAQLWIDLTTGLPTLLSKQPSVTLETITFETAEGQASGRFSAGLSEPPPAGFLADITRLAPLLLLTGELDLPEPLARRWSETWLGAQLGPDAPPLARQQAGEEFLTRMRANQILIRDQQRYRMAFDYANEELILNDQRMLLPTF